MTFWLVNNHALPLAKIDQDWVMENPYKINNYRTHVHIYRGQLIFGDAIEIIKELKKSHDPEKASDPDPFLEWDEIQLDNLNWEKK